MTTPSPISGDNEAEMKPWSVVVMRLVNPSRHVQRLVESL